MKTRKLKVWAVTFACVLAAAFVSWSCTATDSDLFDGGADMSTRSINEMNADLAAFANKHEELMDSLMTQAKSGRYVDSQENSELVRQLEENISNLLRSSELVHERHKTKGKRKTVAFYGSSSVLP